MIPRRSVLFSSKNGEEESPENRENKDEEGEERLIAFLRKMLLRTRRRTNKSPCLRLSQKKNLQLTSWCNPHRIVVVWNKLKTSFMQVTFSFSFLLFSLSLILLFISVSSYYFSWETEQVVLGSKRMWR